MNRRRLEARLAELPLYQYAFIRTDELVFSERVRQVCREHCPMYGARWVCPPAVGTVDACRARATAFEEGLFFATAQETDAIANFDRTLETRDAHEAITRRALDRVREQAVETLTLSAGGCGGCRSCTWPGAPCRFPERAFPCVESYGILVSDLAERRGFELSAGNAVLWFSLILYR